MFQIAKLQHKKATKETKLHVYIMSLLVSLGNLHVKHWSSYVRCKWATMNYVCNES
jgi:hypothetical protein